MYKPSERQAHLVYWDHRCTHTDTAQTHRHTDTHTVELPEKHIRSRSHADANILRVRVTWKNQECLLGGSKRAWRERQELETEREMHDERYVMR